MSLQQAVAIGRNDQQTPPLPQGPPYLCKDLAEWVGFSFWLPPTDPRLATIHHGQPAPTAALENLEGMVRYWEQNPEWMDMLDPDSPMRGPWTENSRRQMTNEGLFEEALIKPHEPSEKENLTPLTVNTSLIS